MKKVTLILASMLIVFAIHSCKKKIYGCMDETAENYSPHATEDAENCVYPDEEEVLVSNTVYDVAWSQWGTQWGITVNWPAITQDILDNGSVNAYIRFEGSTDWYPLPFSVPSGYANVTTSYYVAYYLGAADIVCEDDDNLLPDTQPNADVKLVVLK